jgi:hypothetical protein
LIQGRAETRNLATAAVATASTQDDDLHRPACVLDDNYATRWTAAPTDTQPWVQLDLGSVQNITRQLLRPEYAWKPCRFAVDSSTDGRTWTRLADHTRTPAGGSPIVIDAETSARYLRITFSPVATEPAASLFEWTVR